MFFWVLPDVVGCSEVTIDNILNPSQGPHRKRGKGENVTVVHSVACCISPEMNEHIMPLKTRMLGYALLDLGMLKADPLLLERGQTSSTDCRGGKTARVCELAKCPNWPQLS